MACDCISKKVVKITLWVTIPLLVLSIVVLVLFPTIYDKVLKQELTLNKGTMMTKIWEDIPLPMYEKLYFFNITNKEDFLHGRAPLNVTEVGPYTFVARWVKKDPQWNSNNTVSYRETRTYHFVPEMSNGTEDDLIYSLNGPFIVAANIAKDYDVSLRAALSAMLAIFGEELIIERTIRELAYEGYEDIIIKVAPLIKSDLPFKNGIFAWLFGKNATDDGLFTVFTGVDDSSKLNFINSWNGEEKLSFWKGDSCNMINGTSVEVGPPIGGDQESYTFYQSFFCRSITLNYTEDQYHFDVLSKRFKPTYDIFANSTENPDNYCFEVGKEHPSGISDVSRCQFGAPIFLSFPHFYLADPFYLKSVNGLNPNEADHGSHLDVETVTGFTVHTFVRFQINIEIEEVEGIFQTYNVTKGIFPIVWVEFSITIDEEFANLLKRRLHNPKIIAYSVLGVLIGVGTVIVIAFLVALYLSESEDDDDPLIDAVDRNSSCPTNAGYSPAPVSYQDTSDELYGNK